MNRAARGDQSWPAIAGIGTRTGGDRRHEPITLGLPFSKGALADGTSLTLHDENGRTMPVQCRVLERWSDNSVRWLLLDACADRHNGEQPRYVIAPGVPPAAATSLQVTHEGNRTVVTNADMRFALTTDGGLSITRTGPAGREPITARLELTLTNGDLVSPQVTTIVTEADGPLRAILLVTSVIGPGLDCFIRYHFFANGPFVRVQVTLRNPQRAVHDGGFWDLGDPSSQYIKDWSFVLSLPENAESSEVFCSPEIGSPLQRYEAPFGLYQDSSGGENWNSTNHLNREGRIPVRFRGYRLHTTGSSIEGLRATPVLVLGNNTDRIAITHPHFWQRFPKAIEAQDRQLRLRLLPAQFGDVHELQGGEQITEDFAICAGVDPVSAIPLDWVRDPVRLVPDPRWYCAAEPMPYITPAADDHSLYAALVNAAIDGEEAFTVKRERIDEYGWRHFGDLYADHETVKHVGPQPLISHYNNQYDAIAGFAIQFFRSGDPRWLPLFEQLARHVIDIDIYHTVEDKPAYNLGLFWHTAHHTDADRATHRTYPRSAAPASGGPSSEHNYSTGLMLYYFMSGDTRAREAAIGLADWVIAMDDGNRTPLRWLTRQPTGLASATGSFSYHGPGRGPGNSIVSLMNAYRLCGEAKYLTKADQLIRRCVHPADDLAARNLLDAERRWYYTVFLQALGRYLDFKAERGEKDASFWYARASLLHYARWMITHEYPYLEKPEILEYPTETWPAQDVRKSEVFQYAAKYVADDEREHFLARAEYFYDYSVSTLSQMPTRTFTRPVVLMLTNGYAHAWFREGSLGAAEPAPPQDFGRPEVFTPQRQIAIRRVAMLAGATALAGATMLASLLL